MNQMEAAASTSFAPMDYEGFGGVEVNEMYMAPVGAPEMKSLMPNEVQVNNAAYYAQAANSYYANNSCPCPQAKKILNLQEELQFWKNETNFWQAEGNSSSKEKETWKSEAHTWKGEAEKLTAEVGHWKAEAMKWKSVADDRQMAYCRSLKKSDGIWYLWKASEDAKVANSHKFQRIFEKLTLERDQQEKQIMKLRQELHDEKQGRAKLKAELQAQNESMEQMKNQQQTLRTKAFAKENELRNKLESQTREYENFMIGANGRVSELDGKVCSLQNDLEQKESIIGGFNHYCGELYESKRLADVELRKLKDFMMALTCDLQFNLGKFMKKYGLSVTPVLDSKWDWRTKEEKCLVSHLMMLVSLTDVTYQEWKDNGLLKGKQAG